MTQNRQRFVTTFYPGAYLLFLLKTLISRVEVNFFQESVSKIFKVYSQQNYRSSHSFVKLAYETMVFEFLLIMAQRAMKKLELVFKTCHPYGESPRISSIDDHQKMSIYSSFTCKTSKPGDYFDRHPEINFGSELWFHYNHNRFGIHFTLNVYCETFPICC